MKIKQWRLKEYKEEIAILQKDKNNMARKVGELTLEKDFLEGKLVSLVSFDIRKEMIDTKHKLSLNKQLILLDISKTAHYYEPVIPFSSDADVKLLNTIDIIHTKHPYYGTRRIVKLLARLGFSVGRKLVKTAMIHMGIRALYPKVRTTLANKEHKKYSYMLNEFKNDNNQVIIENVNQVWSTDITYIKLAKGFVYLAAIIDWHSKKILSWSLSNSMDISLTTGVLNDALTKYPKPDILNTDQGSQYTAREHIKILLDNEIGISMDGKGRSIDNIVIERFWRSLKYEDVYPASYLDIQEARKGIEEYIKIYNKERLHSALDYLTPDEVYYKGANDKCYMPEDVLLKVA